MEELLSRNQDIIVFGAGVIARAFVLYFRKCYPKNEKKLLGCMVSSKTTNVSNLEGVPVYEINELMHKRDVLVLIAVKGEYYSEVLQTLDENGFQRRERIEYELLIKSIKKDVSKKNTWKEYLEEIERRLSKEEFLMFLCKQLKNELTLEVNVVDHCNLNCQCCNHFSPIAKKRSIDLESLEKDLLRLKNIFGNRVGRLMLLGGEPLLYDKLIDVMHIARKLLNGSGIYIVTNGTLFNRLSQDFWDACIEYDIGIKVTRYPISIDYDYWIKYAADRGVEMVDDSTEEIKTTYRLPIMLEESFNGWLSYAKCYHANQCVVLREGYLYTCPMGALSFILNEKFGISLPDKEENGISIHNHDDEEILDFLRTPIPLCSHCDVYNYKYNIPWKMCSHSSSEWIGEYIGND